MADAAVSMLVTPLNSMIEQLVREEISLVKGVENELRNVSSKLQQIRNVLDDAEKRSIKDAEVRGWLENLKDISYDMDDVLDEWNTEISKSKSEEEAVEKEISCSSFFTSFPFEQLGCSSFFTCFPFKQLGLRHDIAWKIKDINARLDSVITDMNGFKFVLNYPPAIRSVESLEPRPLTTSIINLSKTYGRESDQTTLVIKLLSEGSHERVNRVPIISIVGVGGLGKTTLAKLVYNDDEVVKRFSKRTWVCVSNPFDMPRVAREIAIAIGANPPSGCPLDMLLSTHLKESISNQKFLLVLDDVWDEEGKNWEDLQNCLEHGAVGSRILVTTRKETVAEVMGTSSANLHKLRELSEEACWSLFHRIASGNGKKDIGINLTKIGREIVGKCKGLPLAVSTLASLLRSKKTEKEWEDVLHSEIWNLEKAEVELFPQLYLSYIELPPPVKRCFSYCSIFPKDAEIDVDRLIHLWMAQGYIAMESKGREWFHKLAMCCFFQDFKEDEFGRINECKMHDIVHDFALYLTKNECITIANNVVPNELFLKARHLTLLPSLEIESPSQYLRICDMGKLRTFSGEEHTAGYEVDALLLQKKVDALFDHLKRVRVVVLKGCLFEKLPMKVGSFVHLRSLDLSGNRSLAELPESMCRLYNLQTLNIDGCSNRRSLPQMIGKLRNLRHLLNEINLLEKYPESFEKLTNLRTLRRFVVKNGFGKLEYLRDFEHLGGSLEIVFEDDVEDADAGNAQLKNKGEIQRLDLINENVVVTEAAWEALQPPPKVVVLTINGMFGTRWPTWITQQNLQNLKRLEIQRFPNFSTMPPLGKLPHLETLVMGINDSIEHIGRAFLGLTQAAAEEEDDRAAAPSSSSSLVCFPRLVSLEFCLFENWEEWEDINEEDDEQGVQIMPCLRRLSLILCQKLKQLPDRLLRKASSVLEELSLDECSGIFGCSEDTQRSRPQLIPRLLSFVPKIVLDGLFAYTRDSPHGPSLWMGEEALPDS